MTIPLRILIGVISGLIGLVFFPMLLVAVIMAWSIYTIILRLMLRIMFPELSPNIIIRKKCTSP